jgi:alpha-amylase/alpha-mannosidase (GH57 family)
MVELLAETPQVRVTFNLVPSLLDQIDAYVSGEAREAELRLAWPPPTGSTSPRRSTCCARASWPIPRT